MSQLTDRREKIDGIDDALTDLFVQRMEIIEQIAAYKKDSGIAVSDRKREREILSRIGNRAGETNEIYEIYSRVLFSSLLDISNSRQNALLKGGALALSLAEEVKNAVKNTPALFPQKGTVACQGAEGAYSVQACDKLFPMADIMYFSGFDAVFGAVERGLCKYGILPIENSSYGSVSEVYDLMRTKKFHIVRSIKLHINHALLAKPGVKLADIREISSHGQALGQCGEFLAERKGVKITAAENTALAAEAVSKSDRRDFAAIASPSCADYYGLEIVKEDVQDNDNNYTRFICIAKEPEIYPGSNKISLMLTLPHEPGSLYRLVGKFAALGINLVKLESRPIAGKDFEFMFYFDFEASAADEKVLALLCELKETNKSFVFLGNYLDI